jgi:tetratricopeptide (TPR) repeat protein
MMLDLDLELELKMTRARSKGWLLCALVVAACGGGGAGKNTTPPPQSTEGPPPGGEEQKPVPVETPGKDPTAMPSGPPEPPPAAASKDPVWDEAVNYFRKQEASGWSAGSCDTAADKFLQGGSKVKREVAYFNAGVAMQRCGKLGEAEKHYRKALEVNPKHAPSLANIGELRYREGKTQEAQDLFNKAVTNDENIEVSSARTNLAWMLYQQMKAATVPAQKLQLETQAIQHLQRTLAIDNDNVVAYTVMALIYMEGWEKNRNRLDVAELLITEGKKRSDRYAPLWNASGILKMKRGSVAKALEDFRQAVALDPKLAEARMNVGQIVLSSRDYKEAENQFREVQKLVKRNYEATVGLGVALRGQATVARSAGQQAEFDAKINAAEDAYKAAMEIDPNRPDAYYNLGLLYKDYRTNSSDQQKNIAQYRRAKQYFQDYLARADRADQKRDEANGHIQDCDKYVTILSKAP